MQSLRKALGVHQDFICQSRTPKAASVVSSLAVCTSLTSRDYLAQRRTLGCKITTTTTEPQVSSEQTPRSNGLKAERNNNVQKGGLRVELSSRHYHEKRNFIRMRMETPIDVLIPQNTSTEGLCHNLSGGGLLISMAEAVPLGTELEVTICSKFGQNPMLKARALVRRLHLESDQPSSRCQMGLQITQLLD